MKKKTIFLDRDGTIIIDKVYLNDPEKIVYIPGVFEALRLLRDHGFQFVIVTNQSGVAKGLVDVANLDIIHALIADEFARHGVFFAGFYYAPYAVESRHFMRKPEPGMLLTAAQDHRADLPSSWMIGDRMTDVEAGHRAGTRTVLIEGVDRPETSEFAAPTFVVLDLLEAAQRIVASL